MPMSDGDFDSSGDLFMGVFFHVDKRIIFLMVICSWDSVVM